MSWRRSQGIALNELRLLRNDPSFAVVLTVMPLLLMAFIKPAFRSTLVTEGFSHATGAEQAVPGMTVMFSFFMVSTVGFSIFREYGWCTWERLRSSPARPLEIMFGKVVVPLLLSAAQLSILLGVGGVLFGLTVRGSWVGVVAVAAALALCLVAMGLALMAVCRTLNQMNAAANLGATFFAGLGGALVPLALLPAWARAVAPVTPSYWAMRGLRDMVLGTTDLGAVLLPVAVLLAFAAAFTAVAALRFRFDDSKVAFA